jgi:hypothetical protein
MRTDQSVKNELLIETGTPTVSFRFVRVPVFVKVIRGNTLLASLALVDDSGA